MNFEKIRWDCFGDLLILRIANGKANIISRQVIEELHRALDEAEQREYIKQLVITGDGDKFFSAGADINEVAEFVLAGEDGRKPMTREEKMQAAYEFSRRGQNLVLHLRNFPKPVTALINGMCFGGGFELALGCHRRVARPSAVLGLPEVTFGIIPGWGGTVFLVRLFAQKEKQRDNTELPEGFTPEEIACMVAVSIMSEGYSLIAKEAHETGYTDEILPGEDARSLPHKTPAPELAPHIERFIQCQQEFQEEEALEQEANYFASLCVLPEAQEGIRAFFEKREPKYGVHKVIPK